METFKKVANVVFASQSMLRFLVECDAGGCRGSLYLPTMRACGVLDNHLGGIVRREAYELPHRERSTNNVRIIFQGEGSDTFQKMDCVVTLTGNIKEGQ
jgi:hypothetical protein